MLKSCFDHHSHQVKCKKNFASPRNPWLRDKLLALVRKKYNLYKKKPNDTAIQQESGKPLHKSFQIISVHLKQANKIWYEKGFGMWQKRKKEIMKSFLNRADNHETISEIVHRAIMLKTATEIANAFADFVFGGKQQTTVHEYPIPHCLPQSLFLFPTSSQEVLSVIKNMKITGADR